MFQENVLLKHHSYFKIGGPAKYFFEAENEEEIIKVVEKMRRSKMRFFVLGGGTNVLFSDDGFNGLIIKIKNLKFEIQDYNSKFKIIRVGAGMPLSELIRITMDNGLSGLEWAAGIPGTVGGAIFGNAGAFGKEMKDVINEVISLYVSRERPKTVKRKNKDCFFDYRSSIFKSLNNQEIIIEASLILKKENKNLVRELIRKNINYRQKNHPIEYPTLGSVFKNVELKKVSKNQYKIFADIIKTDPFPVIPVAYLISEAGLKGVSCGGAMISSKHPNFIVNVLDATAEDVKNLISLCKKEVYNKFKIELEEEIIQI